MVRGDAHGRNQRSSTQLRPRGPIQGPNDRLTCPRPIPSLVVNVLEELIERALLDDEPPPRIVLVDTRELAALDALGGFV
jgi:hypothetical protein